MITEAYVSKTVFKGDVCVPGDPKTAVGFNSPHSVGPGEELSLLGLCSEVFLFLVTASERDQNSCSCDCSGGLGSRVESSSSFSCPSSPPLFPFLL